MAKPLVCVLKTYVDKHALATSFPKFDWCIVESDLYETLNAMSQIPDVFVTFGDTSQDEIFEWDILAMTTRNQHFEFADMADFASYLQKIETFLEKMGPVVHYRVTDNPIRREWGPCAYDIACQEFYDMQYFEQPSDRHPHFWIDFSSRNFHIRQFVQTSWPNIQKYKAIANMYHDTSKQPLTTSQLQTLGLQAWNQHIPFSFTVCMFFFYH